MKMTTKQLQVFEFIEVFIKKNGFSPTYRQIGLVLGINPGTVRNHIYALEAKGFLKMTPNESRSIILL